MTPFEQFWDAYPRKVAKLDAQKAWRKMGADLFAAEMLAGLEWWKRTQWREMQFVPYPATWLRGRRWEDAPKPAQPQPAVSLEQDMARLERRAQWFEQHGDPERARAFRRMLAEAGGGHGV